MDVHLQNNNKYFFLYLVAFSRIFFLVLEETLTHLNNPISPSRLIFPMKKKRELKIPIYIIHNCILYTVNYFASKVFFGGN